MRRKIVEVINRHFDEIIDETVAAYERDIPSVARAPVGVRQAMRTATARATRAFLEMYAGPSGSERDQVERARAVTIERAGEIFEREDILEMIRIGRNTIYTAARRFVEREVPVSEETREELRRALDAFLNELDRSDAAVTRLTPDVLTDWLERAELEGPDVR